MILIIFAFLFYCISTESYSESTYCGTLLSDTEKKNCLKEKIYSQIPSDLIYRIDFRLLEYKIIITTYNYERGFARNFTYVEAYNLVYQSLNGPTPNAPNPTILPTTSKCSLQPYRCSDGITILYPNPSTCIYFGSCPSSPSPSPTPYYTLLGFIFVAVIGVVFFGALIFFFVLRHYRQKQALQDGLNNENTDNFQNTNNSYPGAIVSTHQPSINTNHPVYVYQPSSNMMTNASVPMGYVPVVQTNVQTYNNMTSDEMYARELQTKFDQGY